MDELLNIVSNIEIIEDIRLVVETLKRKHYLVGIISHSYTLIANYVKQNIGGDFALANQLNFYRGKATGEVNLPSYFFASPESICGHAYCKTNALQYACDKYNVSLKNCIVVSNDREDRCILAHAGKGVALGTEDEILKKIAHLSIPERTLAPLLNIA